MKKSIITTGFFISSTRFHRKLKRLSIHCSLPLLLSFRSHWCLCFLTPINKRIGITDHSYATTFPLTDKADSFILSFVCNASSHAFTKSHFLCCCALRTQQEKHPFILHTTHYIIFDSHELSRFNFM